MVSITKKLLVFLALPVFVIGIFLYKNIDFQSLILKGSILGTFVSREQQEKWIIDRKIVEADTYLNQKPSPVLHIEMEGRLDGDSLKIKSVSSLKDVWKVYALSFAFNKTNDQKYLNKSREYLLSWANLYKSEGNSIDDSHLEPLIYSYNWVSSGIADSDKQLIDSWFLDIYSKNEANKEVAKRTDNWNSHRINIMGQIAFALDDKIRIDNVIFEYKKQLENNLNPDGTTVDLIGRDALHYHIYDLTPLLSLAKTAKLNGVDIYTYTTTRGANLELSMQYLIPYLNGDKTHNEYVNSKAEWDLKSAQSGQSQSKIGKVFNPAEGLGIVELYHFFNPNILPTIQKLRSNYAIYPSFEVLLNTLELRTLP